MSGSQLTLRVGSRGSALALRQVDLVIAAFTSRAPELKLDVVPIRTSGDKKQSTENVSDKKEWVLEIEESLLRGEIDFAIHSAKDVPIDIEAGTTLTSILPRANPFDVFIGRNQPELRRRIAFEELSPNALIGTSSVRRAAQLRRLRTDLRIEKIRGNVQTRVQKLDAHPEMQGIVLARAGLERLNAAVSLNDTFSKSQMLPAVNQGILVAQYRSDDIRVKTLLDRIVDPETQDSWLAERQVIQVLEADCSSAVGVFAEAIGGQLLLSAQVLAPSGELQIVDEQRGKITPEFHPSELGNSVARKLLERGARKLLFPT